MKNFLTSEKALSLILLIVFIISLFVIFTQNDNSELYVLSKKGSRGEEVRQIQTRLKQWGYYAGNVDGIYGDLTVDAVRKFQAKNGLKVDGIAGPQTLAAIGLPTGQTNYYYAERNLLTRIISAESRGEPYEGQVAVGAVIMNRVKHPSFPNTISGVIYQPGAFTALTDGQIHAAVDPSCARAADAAFAGVDPTGGAIYYYNPAKTTNKWIYSRPVVKTIGTHVFAK